MNLKTYKQQNERRRRRRALKGDMTRRLIVYMESNYEMRYNTITGCTEMRPLGTGMPFAEADERMRNTIAIRARLDGIDVWDKDIKRYTDSTLIPAFDPVSDFINSVRGQWDGHDRLTQLAACVHTGNRQWPRWLAVWMRGMVAQWMGLDRSHGNSVAPLLISPQGYGKSTFCKQLLPEALQWGYTDHLALGEKRNTLLAMSQFLLINIDEFNAVPQKTQEGFLKNIMQLADIKQRKAFGNHSHTLPRRASFIATANMADVLTDPSGSRRFLAVTVKAPICLPDSIDYTQLYAQLVDELAAGKPYWFDDKDTEAIISSNRAYRQQTPAEALFLDHFALPATPAEGQYMTASAIFTHLRAKVGSQLRLSSLSHFGRVLANVGGLVSKHTNRGTEYLVSLRP